MHLAPFPSVPHAQRRAFRDLPSRHQAGQRPHARLVVTGLAQPKAAQRTVRSGGADGRQNRDTRLGLSLLPDNLFRHADDLGKAPAKALHPLEKPLRRNLILATDQIDELFHPEPRQEIGDLEIGKALGPTRSRPPSLQRCQKPARLGQLALQRLQPPSCPATVRVGLGDGQEDLRIPGKARR